MSTPTAGPSTEHLDRLLAECVEKAGHELDADGAFWPFALALTAEGELVEAQVTPPGDDPSPEEVLTYLRDALRQGRDVLTATAVCADVVVSVDGGMSPALRVELETREGDPLALTLPYRQEQGQRPRFSPPVGQRDVRRTWA